jgi:hypothetical protein
MTVDQYWRKEIGADDKSAIEFNDLRLESYVGEKCRQAIDSAKVLLEGTASYDGESDAKLIKQVTVKMMEVWYFG